MADETTTAETTQTTTETTEAPAERTVPYDRFKSVNDAAKAAKTELDELKSRLEEIEDRDKSETERERKAREKAEAAVLDLQNKLTSTERSAWLRNAAQAEKFVDPSDAVARLGSQEFASEADAQKAVKDLAKESKHLIQSEGDTPPPEIGQVVKNGQAVEATDKRKVEVSAREQEAQAIKNVIDQLKGGKAA